MKIKNITSQHRRDFTAVYECETCGNTQEGGGYDDHYFHDRVIRNMKCEVCGKTAPEDYRPLQPLHPANATV